jgi:ubiquinone/menaquinone biosynthesis C-methylase UbiE
MDWSREEALHRLEPPRRLRSREAERLWSAIDLRSNEVVVDVGAGTGYFALPAAERAGPRGAVIAVDVSPELIALLRERGIARHLRRLRVVQSTPWRIPIRAALADVVLLANLLHGVPDATISESARLLRPGGRLVVVDWVKRRTPHGPPVRRRLSRTGVLRRLMAHGLTPVALGELGRDHYLIVGTRPR